MGEQHKPHLPRDANDPPGTHRPDHCQTMAAAQATTNDWATVPESILRGEWHNRVAYLVVEEEGGEIEARLVGRHVSVPASSGTPAESPWQPIGSLVDIDGDGSGEVDLPYTDRLYDEYAIQVRSNVEDVHGAVKVYGSSRLGPAAPLAIALEVTLTTLSVALEAEVEDTSDVIVANLSFNQVGVITCRAELFDADMVPAVITDAHVGVEAAGGTELTTTAQQGLLFQTNADGTAAMEITDVDGDLETSYWLVITPLDVLCPPKAVEIEFTEPA